MRRVCPFAEYLITEIKYLIQPAPDEKHVGIDHLSIIDHATAARFNRLYGLSTFNYLCINKRAFMGWSYKGMLYQLFIDPLISGLRNTVAAHVGPSDRVIDVACGTGALTMAMAGRAAHVTGIDLSEDMIITARRTAERRGITNVTLALHDASDLSCYNDKEFDVAVASMAMHQFEAGLAVNILAEMDRIAKRVIIADYNCPMQRNLPATFAWSIEYMAAGDHYSNFRIYMQNGGMPWLAGRAGVTMEAAESRGGGVFVVAKS